MSRPLEPSKHTCAEDEDDDDDGGGEVYVSAVPKHRATDPMVRRNLSLTPTRASDYSCTNMNKYLLGFKEAVDPNLTRCLHL